MSRTEYVFQNTSFQAELNRLRSIEAIFDPATRRRLLSAGLKRGMHCLEVGAGAGSIMAWISSEAGPSGRVTAVDINTRFISNPPPNVQLLSGDIQTVPLKPDSFDLIHARYVLVHIPEYQTVLQILWRSLKPGGSLVIEEPDFSAFRAIGGSDAGKRAFKNIHQAINQMYSSKGIDPALGMKLPVLFQELGAKEVVVENDAPISRGGSDIAEMMRMSSIPLKEKYIATGKAAPADIDDYEAFTADPDSSAIYYATIGVIGWKEEVASRPRRES
ncbi:MAG: class I SAM-dependent methyltransferase [Candidatus Manganitrophus sp.]|nr:MAG: class I SAM-dependent methyltransferase [Candidatus Manganitrophus sp.]